MAVRGSARAPAASKAFRSIYEAIGLHSLPMVSAARRLIEVVSCRIAGFCSHFRETGRGLRVSCALALLRSWPYLYKDLIAVIVSTPF